VYFRHQLRNYGAPRRIMAKATALGVNLNLAPKVIRTPSARQSHAPMPPTSLLTPAARAHLDGEVAKL
jgi:hypothetical protein